jgi:hypothetical protein
VVVFVIVDMVPVGLERRPKISRHCASAPSLIRAVAVSWSKGSMPGARRLRHPDGKDRTAWPKQPVWLLIANTAYALNAGNIDEI